MKQTPGKRRAIIEQTSSKRQANIEQTSSKYQAKMKQTSSKHEAIRAHVVHVYIEYVCMTSAWCLLHRVNGV